MQSPSLIEQTADHLPSTNGMPEHPSIVRIALAARQLDIAVATLRDIRFYSLARKSADGTQIPGNGFATAFLTLGRAVYVDIPVFVEIWRSQQQKEVLHG